MTKPKKQTLVEIADEISNTTSWIEGAKEELAEYGDNKLDVRVEQRRSNFTCHYISPRGLSNDANEQISDFIKDTIRTEIKRKQNRRSTLIRKMRRQSK